MGVYYTSDRRGATSLGLFALQQAVVPPFAENNQLKKKRVHPKGDRFVLLCLIMSFFGRYVILC